MKDCPFCGEQINARDNKCKHCQSDLSAAHQPQRTTAEMDKGQKLAALISSYHKNHRVAHPLTPKDQSKPGGIMGFIKKQIDEMKGVSEVSFMDEITPLILTNHHKYASGIKHPLEKPLFVVNTTCGMTETGIILTTQNLYYSIEPGKAFSMGLASNKHGGIPLNDIRSLAIGDSDLGLGTAYYGHDFFLNGQKIGWLRMGTGICLDDEVLECTKDLFARMTIEIFSR